MAVFESETFEVIVERMLSRIPDDVDKREGSVAYDLLAPAAIELAIAYYEMDNVLSLGFVESTYGEYLDRRADEQGLIRKIAITATGTVSLSGASGTVVPGGTRVSTDSAEAIFFSTVSDATLNGGWVDVAVRSEEGGLSGNVSAGEIKVMTGDFMGVVTVINNASMTGGVDAETDEELIARYKEHVSRPATSGNKYHYEQWAKEVAGVSDARCYPTWNGPGTVKVVIINGEKRSPAASVVTDCRDHIEQVRPVNATVTVTGVTEVPLDVSATLTLTGGATIGEARTQFIENLTNYFKSIAFTETIVRYSQIGNALLDVVGVIDYSDLRVNGVVSNIELQADEVPVVGAITIN